MATKSRKATEKNVEPTLQAAGCTLALLLLAAGIILASSLLIPHLPFRAEEGTTGAHAPGQYGILRAALSALNVLLVTYILFIYVRDYLATKSKFTGGLIVFLFSFLLYSMSTLPWDDVGLVPEGAAGALTSFVPLVFSALALMIFAKISNE